MQFFANWQPKNAQEIMAGYRLAFCRIGYRRRGFACRSHGTLPAGRSMGFRKILTGLASTHSGSPDIWTFGSRVAGTRCRWKESENLGNQRNDGRGRIFLVCRNAHMGCRNPSRDLRLRRHIPAYQTLCLIGKYRVPARSLYQ